MWLCDVPGGDREGFLGWQSGYERESAEAEVLWEAVELDEYLEMWSTMERVRMLEMGAEPHW